MGLLLDTEFTLNAKNEENACEKRTHLIMPHLPNELPFDAFRLPYGDMMTIDVRVKSFRADESVNKISVEQRECYFEDEKKLKYFKSYTRKNCFTECIANITLHRCGCAKIDMVRDKNTKVCNFTELVCASNIRKYLREEDYSECACLSSCNDLKYSFDTKLMKYADLMPDDKLQ